MCVHRLQQPHFADSNCFCLALHYFLFVAFWLVAFWFVTAHRQLAAVAMEKVKTELQSPAKRVCLNEALLQPKLEGETTPVKPAGTAAAVSPFPAATAPAAAVSPLTAATAPEKSPHSSKAPQGKMQWQRNLIANPSRIVISLSSPATPTVRGTKRSSDGLPVHHNRPPPPPPSYTNPPDDSCEIQYLAAELEAAALLEENPAATATPRSDTGGTGTPCLGKRGRTGGDIRDEENPECIRPTKEIPQKPPRAATAPG